MKLLPAFLSLSFGIMAQAPAPPPPPAGANQRPAPKNLKLLQPSELMPAMRGYTKALGVECTFCHIEGNFASDEKQNKEIARKMISMARDINGRFPDQKEHVTCYTCHRGATEPAMAPTAGQ